MAPFTFEVEIITKILFTVPKLKDTLKHGLNYSWYFVAWKRKSCASS